MCFEMYYAVDSIEEPDATQTFDIFRVEGQSYEAKYAQERIDTAIKLWIDNRIVQAVLEEAAKHPVENYFTYGVSVLKVPERAVVFTDMVGQRFLDPETTWPETTYATPDLRMENKTIVLQLKDFGYVVMYSVKYSETPESYIHAVVSVKFGIEAESGTTYNCNPYELRL